jgi:integrase
MNALKTKPKKKKPAKLTKKLTHVVVRQLVARGKPGETGDAGCLGLRLLVLRPGRGSWLWRYRRPTGEPANLTIGIVDTSDAEPTETPKIGDPLTLASAHALVADLRRQLNRGVDPGAQHLAEKRRIKARVDETDKSIFAAACVAFVKEYAKPKQRKWAVNARVLGIDPHEFGVIPRSLADVWGERRVDSITDAEITAVIDRARYHGVPGLPRRVKAGVVTESRARALYDCLSRLFSWLRRRGVTRVNPVESVEAPEGSGKRDRKLSDSEVRWFWFACDAEHPALATALRLLLVLGQRLREITEMEWSELGVDDHGNRILTLPPSRTKNKHEHVVQLSPLAIGLIDGVKKNGRFVFSHTDGRTPISISGDIKKRLMARMLELAGGVEIPHFTLHDLRHTAARGLQRSGAPIHITEKILNHVSGSTAGIAGLYQSFDYPVETRAALTNWSKLLERILATGHTGIANTPTLPLAPPPGATARPRKCSACAAEQPSRVARATTTSLRSLTASTRAWRKRVRNPPLSRISPATWAGCWRRSSARIGAPKRPG